MQVEGEVEVEKVALSTLVVDGPCSQIISRAKLRMIDIGNSPIRSSFPANSEYDHPSTRIRARDAC